MRIEWSVIAFVINRGKFTAFQSSTATTHWTGHSPGWGLTSNALGHLSPKHTSQMVRLKEFIRCNLEAFKTLFYYNYGNSFLGA